MTVALHRPGAIGDILMTLNLVPLLRLQRGREHVQYYCHGSYGDMLKNIMQAAGVAQVMDSALWGLSEEPRVNLIGYPLREGYPEKPMRQHLLYYFAEEMGVPLPYGLPRLMVPRPKRLGGLPRRYATLQVKAGWSAYKEWPLDRWAEVVELLPEVVFVQVGAAADPQIPGADHRYMGLTFDSAFALIANAFLHVGIDSFAQHAAHFAWDEHWTPSVVLWGSTQASAAGYPDNINLSAGLSCSPCFRENPAMSRMSRGPCINPPGQVYSNPQHACMANISVHEVVDAIRSKL